MPAVGQETAVSLVDETLTLNSLTRLGGKNRVIRKLLVTPDTKYIIVNISVGQVEKFDNISLLTAVSGYLATGGTGIAAAMSTIETHMGDALLDAYVTHYPNCAQSYYNGYNICNVLHALENSNGGNFYIPVNNPYIPYYLCLGNPQAVYATPMRIEVVAYEVKPFTYQDIYKEVEPAPPASPAIPSYQFDKDKYKKQKIDTRLLQYSKEPAKAMEE